MYLVRNGENNYFSPAFLKNVSLNRLLYAGDIVLVPKSKSHKDKWMKRSNSNRQYAVTKIRFGNEPVPQTTSHCNLRNDNLKIVN